MRSRRDDQQHVHQLVIGRCLGDEWTNVESNRLQYRDLPHVGGCNVETTNHNEPSLLFLRSSYVSDRNNR
eukprot:scaffold8124_cov101-Cylindrotheca_fusiformis.AAC.4